MVKSMKIGIVDRWVTAAKADMIRNNMIDVMCPCRKCKGKKLIRPDSGDLENHLIMRGFMDGYTRWISDEDNAYLNRPARNEEGPQNNNGEGGR